MQDRSWAGILLTVLFVVLVAAFVGGRLLGHPVLLSYVATGSMEPTLAPGDGFVVFPPSVAGGIERGDVIVFQAQQLHGGGLTTHRVVGVTPEGFVTKGDANPFTDQSGGELPVKRGQVVGVVPSIGDHLVVIPYLGLPVLAAGNALSGGGRVAAGLIGGGSQGLAYLLFGVGIAVYAASLLNEGGERRRTRDSGRDGAIDTRLVVTGLTVLVVLAATGSMVVASGPHTFDVISAENDAPGPRVIPTGESETLTYTIRNDGVLPVSVFVVPGDGVDMSSTEARIERGGSIETEVTLSAPDRTGYYSRVIVEHWYLGVLPHSTIRSLYAVHSWVPVLVIDFLLGTGFAALATGTVGLGQQRLRDRSREGANAWWPFDG